MDRLTRFKLLRALWARAKNLLAWLYGPRTREERLRAQTWQQIKLAQRWQQINVTERHLRDGMIRGTGDPDSYLRGIVKLLGLMPSPGSRRRILGSMLTNPALRPPALSLEFRPNSRSDFASLGGTRRQTTDAVVVGSVGQSDQTRTESAGRAPPT